MKQKDNTLLFFINALLTGKKRLGWSHGSVVIIWLAICLLSPGCKKEHGVSQPCNNSLIAAVHHSNGNWYRLSYNADRRLSKLTVGDSITSFEYRGDSTIVTVLDSGHFVSRSLVSLNGLGLATNVRTEKNEAGTNWFNTFYEYNGAELMRSTITSSGGISPRVTTYTWANHNLASATTDAAILAFGYYSDKPVQHAGYLEITQLFQGYELYRNKNLLKSISGSVFNYQFGPGDQIAFVVVNSGGDPDVFNYGVSYQCD